MDLDHLMKKLIKRPVQNGSVVLVYNGDGEIVERYRTVDLGKAYFTMSNDLFYKLYGFNFVPSGEYWELSKRAAGKM